jgi:hypothetical protein
LYSIESISISTGGGRDNLKSSTDGDKEESKESDYDEDQLEEQEEETGEVTINQVF